MNTKSIPTPGFGTYRLTGDTAKKAIGEALEVGFRHIDTAQIYENEGDVGEAIAQSNIPRDEIYITTKVWFDNLTSARFISSVKDSLKRLQTESVDLLLIHWPSPNDEVPMETYLEQLRICKEQGLTKNIGVSNFTQSQLAKAQDILGDSQILTNQIEVHPYFNNRALVDYCQQQKILVTAYMPLAVGKVMNIEVIQKIAESKNVDASSIALAWLNMKMMVSIPSSTNKEHMAANLAAKDIILSDAEIEQIDKVNPQKRMIDPSFAPDW